MSHTAHLNAELVKKYDSHAPRYTSYPTAPQFHGEFKPSHYADCASRSNGGLVPKNLSIYIHIPFCESLCYFCGCNKIISNYNETKVDDYLEHLFREINLRAQLFKRDRLVTQIHFGGGTPNFLRLEQITDVLDQIAKQFHLDLPGNLEISIELDPRSTTPKEVKQLHQMGFNRFSIGVQDFSKDVQAAINRHQDERSTLDVVQAAMESCGSVNLDLITGLPKQSLLSFSETLDKVIDSGVTRIAAYNFAYLPERIKAQRLIDPSSLPTANERLALTALARDKLLNAGYHHIGMDHYALPNDPLSIAKKTNSLQRNFQGYTTQKGTDLIGVGVSAISKFDTSFSQNETSLSKYKAKLDARELPISKGIKLSNDDRLRAEVIQQIMCRNDIDLSQKLSHYIECDNTLTLRDYFKDELETLNGFAKDGLLTKTQNGFEISDTGRYLMRPIAATFDTYFTQTLKHSNVPQIRQFSRVV